MSYPNFFLNLNGFENGVVLYDHGKYDFLSYERGKIFGSLEEYNLNSLNFKKIKGEYNQDSCTCTEINLINVFSKNPSKIILVNHSNAITTQNIDRLFNWYKDGNQKALALPIQAEIGTIYDSLEIEQKIEILLIFSDYCVKHSYFEGFATQNCLFAIGYIQAYLLKANRELSTLEYLGYDTTEDNININKKKLPISITDPIPNEVIPTTVTVPYKIEVTYKKNMEEIFSIWSVLLENLNGVINIIQTKSKLNYLLNQIFSCNEFNFTPSEPFDINSFGKVHRDLFDFLMRISKSINSDNKFKNEVYCKALKKTFTSTYSDVDKYETISKNWANKNDATFKLIFQNLGNKSHVYQSLEKEIRKGNLNISKDRKNNIR